MEKKLLETKKMYEIKKEEWENKSNRLSKIRIFLFLFFFVLVFFYSNYSSLYVILLLCLIVVTFLFVVHYHNRIDKEKETYENYLKILEKYEKRRCDDWKCDKDDFRTCDLSFLGDLDIIGRNSLFQFINFTSSLGGKEKLIDTLSLKRVDTNHILENQKAIEELKNNFEFVLFFQEKLTRVKNIEKTDFKNQFYLFDQERKSKKVETILSILFSFFTIISFLLAFFQILTPACFVGFFLFQLAASYFYTILYNDEFDAISKCARNFGDLLETYEYIEGMKFQSKKNQYLQEKIRKGKEILEGVNKISLLNSYRFNFITNILLNAFFSLNFIVLYKYEKLLEKECEAFKESIIALEEFEVLISLTTIGLVKEKITFPTIRPELSLKIENMRHPLLEEKKCVPNNFQCQKDIQIITGSNMSGKTSFMRTIGINLVLAYTGTYVNCDKFTCSIMQIFTSINVKDDLSNGISTFYGELQRIKNALEFSEKEKKPMVVFIDEIFKGTNYNDRILGAKEVLRKLSNLPCIVFLTTHDFELCEIDNRKIHNYHFEESYKKDKISFDYKIKVGQCKTTNAKYLMKQIGIID